MKRTKLTEQEKKRLAELIALKKSGKLSDADKAELAALDDKTGYRKGSSGSKGPDFKPGNDFSWWNKYPEIVKDAANYKSAYIAGDPISPVNVPVILPGVIAITLQSVYGKSKDVTDPLNVWARDLYLKMFQRFRVPSTYSASDLGIAIIAAVEVVKAICVYERIYGVINRYAKRNLNMPFTEAQGLGLDLATVTYLQGHLSDFRGDLNFLIQKAQRLVVPKDLSIVADAISLFGYSYLDHDNDRAQIVEFRPYYLGEYDDNGLQSGGCIRFKYHDYINDYFDFTADNMCKALDNMLNALLGSDSIQRISADITTWFGEESLLRFTPVPDDFTVVPTYSESILHKIHNLECIDHAQFDDGTWVDSSLDSADQANLISGNYCVYQCADRIVSYPTFRPVSGSGATLTIDGGIVPTATGPFGAVMPAHVLDTYRVEMNEETVVEGVMYKSHFKVLDDGTNHAIAAVSCNFYIVSSITAYTVGSSSVTWSLGNVVKNNPTVASANAGLMAILDWAPLSYDVDGGLTSIIHVYGDVDTVIEMPSVGLYKLSRAIIMSGLKTDMTVKSR